MNLRKRWEQHRRSLRKDQHGNRYLQAAWNKYGEENFEFSVLEFVDVINLLRAEQEWIDTTGCVDKHIGFNIVPVVEAPGGAQVQVWEGFIDPLGNEITIVGLEEFAAKITWTTIRCTD